jgi:hypothetical protein
MELSKYAQAIKNELALALDKQGSSLYELEESLRAINTGEGVYKAASIALKIMQKEASPGITDMAYDAAKAIPETLFKGTLGAGAAAGLSLDEMDKSVDSVNKALEREQEKVNLVRRITQNLKREHGIQ